MKATLAAALVLLLAGCAAPAGPAPATSTTSEPASPTTSAAKVGHIHTVFRMFDERGEVNFTHPHFDFPRTRYLRAHLHLTGSESSAAQYVIHTEGTLGFNLSEFFATLGVALRPNEVVLDHAVHAGHRTADNATHAWQLWLDRCDDGADNWVRQPAVGAFRPVQFDRMLITNARTAATGADLRPQTETVPPGDAMKARYGGACGEP